MMTLNASQTVREIAVENPATVRIFESFGIDYCCGGRQPLKDACVAAGVPLEEVLQRLTAAPQAAGSQDMEHWRGATLGAITGHIVEAHHSFVRRETPRLKGLFEKVRGRHDQ